MNEEISKLRSELQEVMERFMKRIDNLELLDKVPFIGQSLHDQIREGGWLFVLEKANLSINTYGRATYDIAAKSDAYLRLLALEKVLNEGKEGDRLHIVAIEGDELYGVDLSLNNPYPVAFNYSPDRDFAMAFAEKEFKLFYNHK